MKSRSTGKIILFGSGETSESGKYILRKVLSAVDQKQKIAILETPTGFQPNSMHVAQEIADVFRNSLAEFIQSVSIIPARKKGTDMSPDNPALLPPLINSDFILMGPGSPTYAVRQLADSLAWKQIIKRWLQGTTLCFSSAGALACGKYTLPVYEIYKVGEELHWINGLNIFDQTGTPLTIITHWNNSEGGKNLDTGFCYMGEYRFNKLLRLLPPTETILGIDENTALIFDFKNFCFYPEGQGSVTLINNGTKLIFDSEKYYSMDSIINTRTIEVKKPNFNRLEVKKNSADVRSPIPIGNLPVKLQTLIKERLKFKTVNDFKKADEIRDFLRSNGYEIRDADKGQEVYKIEENSHP